MRRRRWRARWYGGGVIACLLGMGSKEVMVSAPLMIVLYDRAFRLNAWREVGAVIHRSRRWFYASLAATLIVLFALIANSPRGDTAGFHAGMGWFAYLHSQGWAILHYLGLVFWPSGLSLDYDPHPVAHWRGMPGLVLLSVGGVITLLAWTRATRWGWLGFLGAWFFLILAPSSSVVPIATEIAAERRMYLPLAAVLMMIIVTVGAVMRRFASRRPRLQAVAHGAGGFRLVRSVGTIALVGLLAALTFQRSRLYRYPEAIWRDAVAKAPTDARGWNYLGMIVANSATSRRAEADSLYRIAANLDPSYVNAWLNLAMSELDQGKYVQARRDLDQIPLQFGNDTTLGRLGVVLLARGDTAAALPVLERLAAEPSSAQSLVDLGIVYLAAGRQADAANAFRHAIERFPARTDLMTFLGGMLIEQGHADQAAPYLEEAVHREPESALDLALLSLDYADVGRSGAAVDAADRAVQLGSEDERVWFFAGRAMLETRRPDLAESYLSRAVGLGPGDPAALADLGQAKLALGKKAEAIDLFNRALRLDPRDSTARAGLSRLR